MSKRITEAEVHAACSKLDAQGVKPSGSKVREILGSGSLTTITNHIRTWEASGAETEPLAEMPETILEAAKPSIAAIWAICERDAEERIQAMKHKADAEIKELRDELAATQKIASELEEAEEGASEEARKTKEKLMSSAEEIGRLKGIIETMGGSTAPKKTPAPRKKATQKQQEPTPTHVKAPSEAQAARH